MTTAAPTRADEILRVASELFAAHGYSAVGMRAIAERVGIRTSSLYHHFPSKADILHRIALEVTRDFIEGQLPLLDGPAPAAERLALLIRRHLVYFWQRRLEESVGLRELRQLAPDHYAEVHAWRRRYQDRIADVIGEGVAAGEFAVPDPRIAALALLDMINGVNAWFTADGGLTIEQLADLYSELAVGGLLQAGRPDRGGDR